MTNEMKKIDKARFLQILNQTMLNQPDIVKATESTPQEKRNAAMRALLTNINEWYGRTGTPPFHTRQGYSVAMALGDKIAELVWFNSEPCFSPSEYLNYYMRALFGDKAFDAE